MFKPATILSFALLAFQIAIPWTVANFATQDGPSHLYTAVVARDLLLHPLLADPQRKTSPYASIYQFQPELVPNWTTTILLGAAVSLFGAAHAEQCLITFCVLAGFFIFSYAIRALAPEESPWTPLANFLLQTWFLWIGFYNFYIGMALFPLVVGYYIQSRDRLTFTRAKLLAGGLAVLFFTHIVPAILAVIALLSIAVWVHLIAPLVLPLDERPSLRAMLPAARHVGRLALVAVPVLLLMAEFAGKSDHPIPFKSDMNSAWHNFPGQVFAAGEPGRTGEQSLLWPVVLFFEALAVGFMTRDEWRGPRGGLFMASVVTFGLYLLVPDSGFGGEAVKIRFAWGVFIFGGLLACSVSRSRPFRSVASIYIAAFVLAGLISAARVVRATSQAVAAYCSAAGHIPPLARFIRLRYPTPAADAHFGFAALSRYPLFHIDAYAASLRRCIDFSDYQANSGLFPVVYRPSVDANQKDVLWATEGLDRYGVKYLGYLRKTLPVPIDYVILVGEENSPEAARTDLRDVLAELNSSMRLISTSQPLPFVRVYQRVGER